MYLTIRPFGTLPGREGEARQPVLYVMENQSGASAAFTDYGARLVQLNMPDRQGRLADVVLGHDDIAGYAVKENYFGATCGRVANRIAPGGFRLNGRSWPLNSNEGEVTLHGGVSGFNQALWDAEQQGDSLCFRHISPHGDQGFPGELCVTVCFTLTDDQVLRIRYQAQTDRDTLVNLTNHSYFNLDGHDAASVLRHRLSVAAEAYLPVDGRLLPTGEERPVRGTPFDFRKPRPIGERIQDQDEQLLRTGGYDHNFCLRRQRGELAPAARLEGESGRSMEVWTQLPGIQLYTANFLAEAGGKGGAAYAKQCAVCLETQYWPDFMSHDSFMKPILPAGQVMTSVTEYRFGVR